MLTNCKNCGAPLVNGRCEYCGAVYAERNNLIIRVEDPRVETIRAQVSIPREIMRQFPDEVAERSLNALARELADGLKGFMRLESEQEPYSEYQIIRGTVRVIPPSFGFYR